MTVKKFVPVYEGELRKHSIQVPRCISECSGIRIFGRRIKSLVFSTDVAIIKNINADAVIAVYPFTPQPAITQAILSVSEVPVFAGVGGGLTNGQRSASIAAYAEHQGAFFAAFKRRHGAAHAKAELGESGGLAFGKLYAHDRDGLPKGRLRQRTGTAGKVGRSGGHVVPPWDAYVRKAKTKKKTVDAPATRPYWTREASLMRMLPIIILNFNA